MKKQLLQIILIDAIAGTSTGGLIVVMLAAPNLNDTSRPMFSTPEILQISLDFGLLYSTKLLLGNPS